jgi:hypothetical protein
MSSRGTRQRNIRVPDDLWQASQQAAQRAGYSDVSAYLRAALVALVARGTTPWTDSKENRAGPR